MQAAPDRQPPINRRGCESALFHVVTEQLDVRTCGGEYVEADRLRPGEEEAEILPVRLQCSAVVAGKERHRCQLDLVHLACDENLIKPNPIR